MPLTETVSFGALLKQMRKRAGMTQRDLAAALNYSDSLISSLEKAQGLPDLAAVITRFVPALGLHDDPAGAAHLIEQAAAARGERPPASITLQRDQHVVVQEELYGHKEQLPLPPTELIGRSKEVRQLCNRVLGHSGRLLTLVGPPGIGKTRLALAVAAHLKHYYPDGVVFVPLAEINDLILMASNIIAAVGGRDASPKPPEARLIEFLRFKTMLLVLDNCEQIRDAASVVAELLSTCAGLVVLATSRERLHLRAEQRYRVPPLELATAIELFTHRAAAVDADFVLTAANRPTVEAICQRLDRLPLAIELCAAQIDLLSLTQLLVYLHHRRLDLLVDGAHDLPPRQRTLRHSIGRSYALLSEEERALFRSLGVFAGGFALPELEAISLDSREGGIRGGSPQGVSGDPSRLLTTLHALVGKSLVRAETLPSGEQRFLLLETIREFALEQLRAQGEEALLLSRHYATYLQLFRTGDSYLRGPAAVTWFARLEAEQDNLRAALQWTLAEARYTNAAWLVVAANGFWEQHGLQYDAGRWLVQLLPHRHKLATDLRLAIWIILNASSAHIPEEFQPVSRYTDEVMGLLEGCSDKLLHSVAWYFLAWNSADLSQASAVLERSIALARAASESPGLGPEFCLLTDRDFVLGTELWGYANFLVEQGEFARAALLARESFSLFQARGNRYERAGGLGILGLLALLQGDLVQAHKLVYEAVTIAAAVNYQEMLCNWQPLLGLVSLYSGDTTEARRLLTESLRRCIEQKDKNLLARNCTYLAETALRERLLDDAAHWLAQSLAYHADPHRITIYEVERLFVAARLATAQKRYPRAATLFGLADQVHGNIHYVITGPIHALAGAALATVRAALGSEVFAEAFATGQQLSLDEAFITLVSPVHVADTLTES